MDDGLLLNIDFDESSSSKPRSSSIKTGRWTDRLKAKRLGKRKDRPSGDGPPQISDPDMQRPVKRPRKDPIQPVPQRPNTSGARTQIISSLFTSNPKISKPNPAPQKTKPPGMASNAPLTDSSTFSGLGLNPLLVNHLESKMDILKPTSVQRAVLPNLLTSGSIRDIFIQSQTGSGKTLSFLLPIIHDLLPLSSLSYIDRSVGTLAIIIAPTKELARQISEVVDALLKLRLRTTESIPEEDETSLSLTRWLVSGLLTGGTTRAHEKARIRKGVPILVSTPGRLLDHLQNTMSFNVGKCRWLVLDEADKLMELGFEETIEGILKSLEGRKNLAKQAAESGQGPDIIGGWEWRERRTILCSATMREDVQKLAGTTLNNPIVIKGGDLAEKSETVIATPVNGTMEKFTPPSQLAQKYVIVPLKLRLVALVALLRSLLSQTASFQRGTKIIVFFSCTDSVDFHWRLLGGATMDESTPADTEDRDLLGEENLDIQPSLLPSAVIFRLHGSLPLAIRTASLRAFASTKSTVSQCTSSVLFCTSVASRGLDLPLVRAVVQYDLPTEGGSAEYVHRVGRTARAGKGGEAWAFISPSESEWVSWVEQRMNGEEPTGDAEANPPSKTTKIVKLDAVGIDSVLKKGFGGKGSEHEERATEVQMTFERWVLKSKTNSDVARKGFLSHMRAYATHPSDEKRIFHVRNLHLGHLAKAFALREAPTTVGQKASNNGSIPTAKFNKSVDQRKIRDKIYGLKKGKPDKKTNTAQRQGQGDREEHSDKSRIEDRMKEVVRAQGRLSKKDGVMMETGMHDFQIADGATLEKIVHGKSYSSVQ